jgi:hypothetical protein
MKKILTRSVLATLAFAGIAFAGFGSAATVDEEAYAVVKAQAPAYPVRTCIVDGTRFSAEMQPVPYVKFGRLLYLCSSEECKKKVEADPEPFFAKVKDAVIAVQKPIYPLTTCIVSGEELGSMGEPIDAVHGTRLVRLCCKGCKKGLAAKPDEFIAKIDEKLVETLRASYPLDKCLVSGNPLGDKAVDKLYGVTLVRLCCGDCTAAFEKDPRALAMKVQDAQRTLDDQAAKDAKGG